MDDETVKNTVSEYYGATLKSSADLKTSACKTCTPIPAVIRNILLRVPREVTDKFYGCGTPLPLGVIGLRVLDLGCGSGRDCYVASQLVGPTGRVTGVDMTPAQLEVAIRHADVYSQKECGYDKSNMTFIHGEIEHLDKAGVASESQDIIISNCVINLSPDKPRVLREAYRVLAPGGEMYFSDVYCTCRLQPEIRNHPIMIGECLGGALYINDFLSICRKVGFKDPRVLTVEPITVDDPELKQVAGHARFYSITFRLFKLPEGELEETAESYGQTVVYRGTLPGSEKHYSLDIDTRLTAGQELKVDGNTASILKLGWLAAHFEVHGEKSIHQGGVMHGRTNIPNLLMGDKVGVLMGDKVEGVRTEQPARNPSTGCCDSVTTEGGEQVESCCGPSSCTPKSNISAAGEPPAAAALSKRKASCCDAGGCITEAPGSVLMSDQAVVGKGGCCKPKTAEECVATEANNASLVATKAVSGVGCCPPKKPVAAGAAGEAAAAAAEGAFKEICCGHPAETIKSLPVAECCAGGTSADEAVGADKVEGARMPHEVSSTAAGTGKEAPLAAEAEIRCCGPSKKRCC
ncbi:hypothetical protein CEUSTIGMA_g855.t1 [Chlamydomonas eustigma]|uniref:Arsenite methyltransferase n=1 Tax=Chlamydomonas eustigma TaxID=1157962 RepID=A0A250WRG4_9CHLO|nr:hypothetical protein CEUSTIGMA_g855.t1 [Chlamydomonas eustigma]|eukprot:GAX73403.1 hypothetical protein CEUSTIGMA_g855.t1 [Chlamydomonas eustigma]